MDWAGRARGRGSVTRARRSSTTRRRRRGRSTSAACAGRSSSTPSPARCARTGIETTLLYGVDDLDPMDAQALLTPDAVEHEMGRPLAHVPDQAGDGHASYARHHAQRLHRHVRRARHPPGPLLLDERHLPDRRTWTRTSGPRSTRRRLVREIYRRVANVQHPGHVAPDQRHLRELRQGRHDDRDASGTASGSSTSAARDLVDLGDAAAARRLGLAVRRPRQAAVEPRVGGPVVAVRRDDRAVRQGPRHGRRLARPVATRSPARCSSASRRSTCPYEFLNIGGKKMSTSKGRGAAAHTIAEVVPPEQLRFLFLRHRPNHAIDFDPDGTDAIPRLFDEFDRFAAATAGPRGQGRAAARLRGDVPLLAARPGRRRRGRGGGVPAGVRRTSRCSSRSRASTSAVGSRPRRGAP